MFCPQFFTCSNPHVNRCSNPLPWDPLGSPQIVGPWCGEPLSESEADAATYARHVRISSFVLRFVALVYNMSCIIMSYVMFRHACISVCAQMQRCSGPGEVEKRDRGRSTDM